MKASPSESMARTKGISVRVSSRYLADQVPDSGEEHLFGYRVTIENGYEHDVQIVNRHWDIIDANGKREEIDGVGVVGQKPIVPTGETYTYGSFCPLATEWGTMEGYYLMLDLETDEVFKVAIARFHLYLPTEMPSPV